MFVEYKKDGVIDILHGGNYPTLESLKSALPTTLSDVKIEGIEVATVEQINGEDLATFLWDMRDYKFFEDYYKDYLKALLYANSPCPCFKDIIKNLREESIEFYRGLTLEELAEERIDSSLNNCARWLKGYIDMDSIVVALEDGYLETPWGVIEA